MNIITGLKKQIREIEGRYNRADNIACFIETGAGDFDEALGGGIYNGQVCELIPQSYIDEVS